MFLQYTKYRDIDAVTWHDACHVTKSPRLSLRLAYRAGQRSYVKLLRGRREEPGNEAPLSLSCGSKVIREIIARKEGGAWERG